MLNENWVFVGIIINALGSISYIKATLEGGVKPNRVTFLLISLTPFLALISQVQAGFNMQSLFILSAGLFPLAIFIASFVNKKAYWKLGIFDIACGVLSVLGLFLWYITKNGNAATTFSILADLLATTPTITKTYKFPDTEKAWPWLSSSICATLTLLTIKNWYFIQYGFPLYAAVVTLIIALFAQFRVGKKP